MTFTLKSILKINVLAAVDKFGKYFAISFQHIFEILQKIFLVELGFRPPHSSGHPSFFRRNISFHATTTTTNQNSSHERDKPGFVAVQFQIFIYSHFHSSSKQDSGGTKTPKVKIKFCRINIMSVIRTSSSSFVQQIRVAMRPR